jgi:hypothetical protein
LKIYHLATLFQNPERHTGYTANASAKIWREMYASGTGTGSQCVFQCAVSGLQAWIEFFLCPPNMPKYFAKEVL